jgi:glycosyltransferase involved in cell wall biosynthesis
MRIIIDYSAFTVQASGGVSRSMYDLFRTLLQFEEHNVILFAGIHRNIYLKNAPEEVKRKIIGVYLPEPWFKQTLFMPLNRFIFRIYARIYKPNICHYSYYDSPNTSGKCKNIATLYDMIHERFPEIFTKNDPHINWKTRTISKAHGIICISENTKTDLLKFYPDLKVPIWVIHIGSDIKVKPVENKIEEHSYLLYVGNRKPSYKNFETVLKAFSEISSIWPGKLLCFGGGKFTKDEMAYFDKMGLVKKVKQISGDDDLLAIAYKQAFALVYPSMYEGFGLPPVEAMSLGCPVLSSKSPPMPEILGDACLYFQHNATNELIQSFKYLLDEKIKSELLENGKRRAGLFTLNNAAAKTMAFYDLVCNYEDAT